MVDANKVLNATLQVRPKPNQYEVAAAVMTTHWLKSMELMALNMDPKSWRSPLDRK